MSPEVKRRIMEAGKTKPISRVKALIGKIAPRFDVAGDQETRHRNTGDAAAHAVGGEDCLTEELLAATDSHRRLGFCWTRRQLKPYLVAVEKVYLTRIVLREQVMEHLFALRAESCQVLAKLVPHGSVLFCCAGQSLHTARPLDGVERGEVAELHGEAVGCTPHLFCNLDDDRVVPVQPFERQLAVKVQRNQEMLPCPFHGPVLLPCGYIA